MGFGGFFGLFFVNCHMFGRYWNGEGCRGAVSVSGREEVPSVESRVPAGRSSPTVATSEMADA